MLPGLLALADRGVQVILGLGARSPVEQLFASEFRDLASFAMPPRAIRTCNCGCSIRAPCQPSPMNEIAKDA